MQVEVHIFFYKSTPTMNIIIVDPVHKTVEEPMHGQQNTHIHG